MPTHMPMEDSSSSAGESNDGSMQYLKDYQDDDDELQQEDEEEDEEDWDAKTVRSVHNRVNQGGARQVCVFTIFLFGR